MALSVLRHCDVIFVYSSPATAAVPGLVLQAARRSRIPLVVHIQDLWPDSVTSSGFLEGARGGKIERVLHGYCDAVYRRADRIAVTSPGMIQHIRARGVPNEKFAYVPNWAEESSFFQTRKDDSLAAALGPFRPFTVMYAGNFGELQDLETVLGAAALLKDHRDIGFALVGSGVAEPRLRRTAQRLGLDNVSFIAPQPFRVMSRVLSLGDAQLVVLKDVPILRSTLPSKLQANLAVAKPIIGAVTGDAASVINASGAGAVSAPGDAHGLAAAIRSISALPEEERAAMGRRGRDYYMAQFSEKVIGDRLSDLLISVAHGDARV